MKELEGHRRWERRNIQESAGNLVAKLVEVVRACNEKRRRIRRQESDCDGGAGEKKERKRRSLNTSGSTRRRENCQERKRKTGLKRDRPHIQVGKDAAEE